jgi:hypothetical protein
MNRSELQNLTRLRVKEAKVLLDQKCFEGSYYLLGYAVECAFKACIAKQTRRYDFPPRPKVINAIYTHDLNQLLDASGLKIEHQKESRSNPSFGSNWAIVKDWSEQSRYDADILEAKARDFYSAVAGRNGVLLWLKKWW